MFILSVVLSLVAIIVGGLLWHAGGDGKWYGLLFGPLVAICKAVIALNPWPLLYMATFWAMNSLFSYGVNAPIHKFWVWVFGGKGSDGSYLPVEICTRATCGFGWSLAAIPFVILDSNWAHQIIYTVFMVVAIAYFGTRKNVELSEIGSGCSTACSVLV
jgi:hypothetical protein